MIKKYIEFKNIDEYSRTVSNKFFAEIGNDFDKTEIQDAFTFIRNYEESGRFDKIAMKAAAGEAVQVLTDFENTCAAIKAQLVADKKEEIRVRNELNEKIPEIWEKKIKPEFKNLINKIEEVVKMPGYEYYMLNEQILKEFSNIEDLAKIIRKSKKIYISK